MTFRAGSASRVTSGACWSEFLLLSELLSEDDSPAFSELYFDSTSIFDPEMCSSGMGNVECGTRVERFGISRNSAPLILLDNRSPEVSSGIILECSVKKRPKI